ncbi:pectate lyase [Oleiharenicola lentus]|uniref:pectate lyase n=1 Tax=Oleiharenicola lentus TaxID=2508720 RepID=UPI003F671705
MSRFRLLFYLLVLLTLGLTANALDARYRQTLLQLCDTLVAAQITDSTSPDFGALVCPSTNPQRHPLHSRGAEAVYPLAIAYHETGESRYRDAARHLAAWLLKIQQPGGAWGEEWPNHDGWKGTTSDQLISLAGAYPILQPHLSLVERGAWQQAMRRAADHVVATFPITNINYQPTGSVALWLATQVVENPPPDWLAKADALMTLIVNATNADDFIVGEGLGVDLGYNLAQSIGYIALYGQLKSDETLRAHAAKLLRAHATFVYPNGSVDNSWGTRSFKWTYESGTKTAPGVYFTFALLADLDPTFGPTGDRCLDYLIQHNLRGGEVIQSPQAHRHASTQPPCLYSTFTRAQSLAMALAYAPATAAAEINPPARTPVTSWHRFFPTTKVAVVRTEKFMATVSAYDGIARYGRELVSRGGSLTNLWIQGFGATGFAQTSSVTVYRREEKAHMPIEQPLRPLTPRIECIIDGGYFTNLFEDQGRMTVTEEKDHVRVMTTGRLLAADGRVSDVGYSLTHRFFAGNLTKEFTLTSPRAQAIRIVEPFVKHDALRLAQISPQQINLQPNASNQTWALRADSQGVPFNFAAGADADRYWCPFPALECVPIVLEITTTPDEPTVVTLQLAETETR